MTVTQSLPLWFAEATAPEHPSDSRWFCLDRIYLHGEIEQQAGFDLLVSPTGPDATQGIYPVVIDISGTTYACTAHVWRNRETTMGLVVLNTDKDAKDYAFSKCIETPDRI